MTEKRFASKIDAWLLLVLVATVVFMLASLTATLYQVRHTMTIAVMLGATILVVLLIGSILLRTYYAIDGETLRIVSGPLTWRVRIDDISSIERTRCPLSSPALSLDRLRIRYGGKSILVSPAQRDRFVRALGREISD